MEEKSRLALDVLRTDPRIGWVAVQLVDSFTEGIAESAKESAASLYQQATAPEGDATPRERTKRERYETSRPYVEAEKIELIEYALEQVFVVVPALQSAAATALLDLGSSTSSIAFVAPDDEERADGSYVRQAPPTPDVVADLKFRFESFREKLIT